jgi:hypothetical protein
MALAVVRTLWTEGRLRCVFLKQLQPPMYAVQLYEGTRVICTEFVDDPGEAGYVAARLWDRFSESTEREP